VTSTVVFAKSNDSSSDNCKNQNFENVYYLLDYRTIDTASVLFQQIPLENTGMESRLVIKQGNRQRTLTYFDDNNLTLLNANKELLHIDDKHLPTFREEKEQVFFNDRIIEDKNKKFIVKNYNRKLTPLDKHILFGRIKRKERPVLIELLSSAGIRRPETVFESLEINSDEEVKLVTHFGLLYGAITLSMFNILDFGVPNTFFLLKLEVFSNENNNLTSSEKQSLNQLFCQIGKQFSEQLAEEAPLTSFGYTEYHDLALKVLPFRTVFRKHPVLFSIGQIVCLGFIGFLFMYLVLGRYTKHESYRKITKNLNTE
jgi:hypothetical protein